MSPERALYEYLTDTVAAAAATDALAGAAVHSTRYTEIAGPVLRIGEPRLDVGPRAGEWKEFNVELLLDVVCRVDNQDFNAAREAVRKMSLEVARAIQTDGSLGGRVCDCRIVKATRGWARIKTAPFAVQVFRLVIDPFGFSGE